MNRRLVSLLSQAGSVAHLEGDRVLRVRHMLKVIRRLHGSTAKVALQQAPAGLGSECMLPMQLALDNLECWRANPSQIDARHVLVAIAMLQVHEDWRPVLTMATRLLSRQPLLPGGRQMSPIALRELAYDVEQGDAVVEESAGCFMIYRI